MARPIQNRIYRIALCGGDFRHWQYLGPDSRSRIWWRDVETGREFDETSVMYAWEIVAEDDALSSAQLHTGMLNDANE